jgi:uncharacterized protein with PQ loop repeat
MELIGWIGAACFALCALPQAIQCYKQKHANGLNNLTLILWLIGEILTILYVLDKGANDLLPLFFNYVVNILLLMVILYYKYFGRNK